MEIRKSGAEPPHSKGFDNENETLLNTSDTYCEEDYL